MSDLHAAIIPRTTRDIDEVGKRFGCLTVVSRAPSSKDGRSRWHCVCECGRESTVYGGALRAGQVRSCGCSRTRHQLEDGFVWWRDEFPTYQSWQGIKQRCLNPNVSAYKNYGGRGITVCERWMSFPNFFADMGRKPDGMTIERIDVNGNYEPGNCKWATWTEQRLNQRRVKKVEFRGEVRLVYDLVNEWGINPATYAARVRRGWPIEKALTTPSGQHHE